MKSPAALIDIVTNLDGDNTRKLSINADGKLFDLLADKVYTDKVKACVRETWSNAYDSHVAAGQDARFKVTLPTNLDPVFTVRDYGTGMDSATVDGVYSTLMDTTKDNDNSQTGFLGIGSKSPFAVSDAFTVICYDGAFQRTYLVARSADGVPGITLLGSDLSQEPQGVEVQVPVSLDQIREFHQKAEEVAFGFPYNPEGVDFDAPEVALSGTYVGTRPDGEEDIFTWSLVKADFLSENYYVRQGVVVYPVPSDARPSDGAPLRYNSSYSLVVDIPLGTADVSPDRESLSLDATTRANVRSIFGTVFPEVVAAAQRQRDAATNWLQRASVARTQTQWATFVDQRENALFVTGGSDWDVPHMLEGKKWGGLITSLVRTSIRHPQAPSELVAPGRAVVLDASDVSQHRFYILRPGVVRAADRVRRDAKQRHGGWGRNQTSRYFHVLDNPTPRQVERLMTLLGLTPNQFITVSSIEDVPPPRQQRSRVASDGTRQPLPKRLSGVYSFRWGQVSLVEELPEDYLWVRSTSRAASHRVQTRPGSFTEQGELHGFLPSDVAEHLGLPTEIIGFSDKALAQHNPDPAKELSVAIAAVETEELGAQVNLARSVRSAIDELYHAGQVTSRGVVRELAADYLPEDYELDDTHELLQSRWFNHVATYRSYNEEDTVKDGIVEAVKATYPLLFKRYFEAEDVAAYKALLQAGQE